MFVLKKQLTVNINILLECEHDTTQEEAEKELEKLLDSAELLTDHKLIFSQFEKTKFEDVMGVD